MTDKEIILLEALFRKLTEKFDTKHIALATGAHDCIHFGVFNDTGNPVNEATGPTLKSCIEKIRQE